MFVRIIQYCGFITSVILNLFLAFLIATKMNKKVGSYKYLMLNFAFYSILFAVIEFCVQPIMRSKGSIFVMMVDSFLKECKFTGLILLSLYTGSFGLCIGLLAAHFFYRYLAICKPQALASFEDFKLIKMFIPGLIMATVWTLNSYFILKPAPLKSQLLYETVLESYQVDIYDVPYVSILYYHRDYLNNLIIDWIEWYDACIAVLIMNICFSTMIYCGYRCYKELDHIPNMSNRTKNLNRQLFRTLVVQTLVPLFTLFIPVSILFTLPMFSIELGTIANTTGAYASIYPALDALTVILMMKDFRDVLFCRAKRGKITTISTKDTSSVIKGATSNF